MVAGKLELVSRASNRRRRPRAFQIAHTRKSVNDKIKTAFNRMQDKKYSIPTMFSTTPFTPSIMGATLTTKTVNITPVINSATTMFAGRIGNKVHIESIRFGYSIGVIESAFTSTAPIVCRVLIYQSPDQPLDLSTVHGALATPTSIYSWPSTRTIKVIHDRIIRLRPDLNYQAGLDHKVRRIPRNIGFEQTSDTSPNYFYTAQVYAVTPVATTDTVAMNLGVEFKYTG